MMAVFLILAMAVFAVTASEPGSLPLYKQAGLPIRTRALDLLHRMTLEEKVAQTIHPWETATPAKVFEQYNETGLGAWYLSMTTLPPHGDTAEVATVMDSNVTGTAGRDPSTRPTADGVATVRARNQMQRYFVEGTRLGIPVAFIMETLHSGGPDATIFPMPINYASSWNLTAVELAARVIADEARAVGTDRGFSPVINLFPDPRYGRFQEAFGEDPYVAKVFGAAYLAGLQGGAMGGPETYLTNFTHALVGTVKHYAGYGAGSYDGSACDVSEQTLREIYLSGWEYLAKGRGLRSVMAAQNMVNGRPMHANYRLLTEVLRKEWNVSACLVESDGSDVIGALQYGFHAAATIEDAATMSVAAGMDMDLGGTTFATLTAAVEANRTSVRHIDRAAYNVLVSKFAAGLFEHPYTDESRAERLDAAPNRALARDAAAQSITMLKNREQLLPLDFELMHRLALVGPMADDPVNLCGSYYNPGARVTTLQTALGHELGKLGVEMTVSRGCNVDDANTSMIPAAVRAAEAADVIVAVLGDTTTSCGEMHDRSSLDLAGAQLPLLRALAATKKPLVVILINGRPATFGRPVDQPKCAQTESATFGCGTGTVLDEVDALLVAWRPGEEGGPALVDVLSGAVGVDGRLTSAWPRTVGAVGGPNTPYLYPYQGNHQGQDYAAGDGYSTPLFSFGEGLSYTKYRLSGLRVSPEVASAAGSFTLSLTAENTGVRAGSCTVQVYFRDPVAVPVRISSIQLVRFAKVRLGPGESKRVTIHLAAADLAYWDDGRNGSPGVDPAGRWVVDPGRFELFIGTAGFHSWARPEGLGANITVR